MRATVAGTIALPMDMCPPKVLERLRRDLSFPNPEYLSRQRMGRYTGATPERIECLLERHDGWIELPRGAVGLLRRRLSTAGITVTFDDRRCLLPRLELRADIELRPYQAEAVRCMVRGVQGSVVMPCGGGKTATGTAAIAAVGQPSLVIVHTQDLVDQWRQSIQRILGIKAGVVGGGANEPGPITVATVQTLVRLEPATLADLAARFGCVIVDECLPGESRVIVRGHGPTAVQDLIEKDGVVELLSFNHEEQRLEFRPMVRRSCKRVRRRMVTIRVRRGRRIRSLHVTEEHPIYVEGRGYVPAIRVRPRDRVLMVRGFYPCPDCERAFETVEALGGHVASAHRGNAGLRAANASGGLCPYCWAPCATAGALKIHLRRHEDPEWDQADRADRSLRMRETNIRDADKSQRRMTNSNPTRSEVVRKKIRRQHRTRPPGAYAHLRGGNGWPPTEPERLLLDRLGPGWRWQHVVPIGRPRRRGVPTHYKIDLANSRSKVAVEVDGNSHHGDDSRERDRRKDELLGGRGWAVLRVRNEAVLVDPEGCAARILEVCRERDSELQGG